MKVCKLLVLTLFLFGIEFNGTMLIVTYDVDDQFKPS